jgi:hypothetical protein
VLGTDVAAGLGCGGVGQRGFEWFTDQRRAGAEVLGAVDAPARVG